MSKSRSTEEKDRDKEKENKTEKEKDCEKETEKESDSENEDERTDRVTNEDKAKGQKVHLPMNRLRLTDETESNLKSPMFDSNSLMVKNDPAIPSAPPPSYEHVIEQVNKSRLTGIKNPFVLNCCFVNLFYFFFSIHFEKLQKT